MQTNEIRIRDPFVFPDENSQTYYLFGSTDPNCWDGKAIGFDYYTSKDLNDWEGPHPAFRPAEDFWSNTNFWAPEVHSFNGRFYLFASFKAEKHYRGTQILVSDNLAGPYAPLTDSPITPKDWECLDGTLYVDPGGNPWIVFCHEWVQIHNGAIYAMQLSADLRKAVGRPQFLFNASEGPWVRQPGWPANGNAHSFPDYITDGPFLHQLANGTLLMLWSSAGNQGYAMGIARSQTGDITGPWAQDETPLWEEDGGHGMIFQTFDGRRMLTFHSPNKSPNERPVFIEIIETDETIELKS